MSDTLVSQISDLYATVDDQQRPVDVAEVLHRADPIQYIESPLPPESRTPQEPRWRVAMAAAVSTLLLVGGVAWVAGKAPGTDSAQQPAVATTQQLIAVDQPVVATTRQPTQLADMAACLRDPRMTEQNLAFLQRWTAASTSLRTDGCVAAGLVGPDPGFVPDGLGIEIPLHPGGLTADLGLPHSEEFALDIHPIVHVGRVGDTDLHTFLSWQVPSWEATSTETLHLGIWLFNSVGGMPHGGHIAAISQGLLSNVDDFVGQYAAGVEGPHSYVFVVVPEETAVAALEIEGEPVAWQRPVAQLAAFAIEGDSFADEGPYPIALTVYDQEGNLIARY